MSAEKIIHILLIEDDQDDVELLKEALEDNGVAYRMDVIKDGGLVTPHINSNTPHPDIIVLDYNLPRVHGRELLKRIKSTPGFKEVPVMILTTSSAKEDMDYAYREGAAKFLIKPTSIKGLNDIVKQLLALIA